MQIGELYPGIVADPDILGGKPVVKGTRIPAEILIGHIAAGMNGEEVAEGYGVTVKDVRAALGYAAQMRSNEMSPIRKAFGYITREHNGQRQVLVFTQRDLPDAGIQIPKGTVEDHETPEQAVMREMRKETGLTQRVLIGEIASDHWRYAGHTYARHFFHLTCADTPDTWDHEVTGQGEDNGMIFRYFWMRDTAMLPAAWGHGDYLERVL